MIQAIIAGAILWIMCFAIEYVIFYTIIDKECEEDD